jgi:putative tryptophan/tyrosine transport system substrate-binding protein
VNHFDSHRRKALIACALACVAPRVTAEGAKSLAVIYPDIGEPFRSVFGKIIEGVEEHVKGRVVSFPVGSNASTQDIAAELRRLDVHVVIALGRNGLKAATALDKDVGVVAGGVISVPEGEARGTVHSLAPDPALLFAQLKSLLPNTRRVLVIHNPRQNAWLMKRAREAARMHGLDIAISEAEDLKTAIRFYQDVFATADPRKDVLWLPQDSTTVDEAAVLPLVLQESWNRNVAVFSSSVAHVKRGALFALYPNNLELGRSLARTAMQAAAAASQPNRGILPLREVLVAVNVRTAGHLGIPLSGKQQSFDLIFPEP